MPLLILCLMIIATGFAAGEDRASQVDDIREAAFRYQFRKNASGLQQKAKVYFLSVRNAQDEKNHDPDEAFMKRFADHKPRVAKASEAHASSEGGVRDMKTGERGLLFDLGEIRWISDDTVEIDGGYYEGGLSASGNTYFLKKKTGKWIVERDRMHWISHVNGLDGQRFADRRFWARELTGKDHQ